MLVVGRMSALTGVNLSLWLEILESSLDATVRVHVVVVDRQLVREEPRARSAYVTLPRGPVGVAPATRPEVPRKAATRTGRRDLVSRSTMSTANAPASMNWLASHRGRRPAAIGAG